jgi:hypothetical protein
MARVFDIYEVQLCNGYSKSILYFEEKHNTVKQNYTQKRARSQPVQEFSAILSSGATSKALVK